MHYALIKVKYQFRIKNKLRNHLYILTSNVLG